MPKITVPLQQVVTVVNTANEIEPVAMLDLNARPDAQFGVLRGRFNQVDSTGKRIGGSGYEVKLDAQAQQLILNELIRLAKAQGVGGLDSTSDVQIIP